MDRLSDALLQYHDRSKHRVNRYAPGPRELDWITQPNPFREFHGAPRVNLLLAADTFHTRYNEVRCGALPSAYGIDLRNLSILFELSLGLSAWKSYRATALGAALQPFEWQPPSDRGLSAMSASAWPARGYLPLPEPRPFA